MEHTHHAGRLVIWKNIHIRKVAFSNRQCILKWAVFRITWICLYTNMLHTHTVLMCILSKIPIAILKNKHSGFVFHEEAFPASKKCTFKSFEFYKTYNQTVGISCGRFPDSWKRTEKEKYVESGTCLHLTEIAKIKMPLTDSKMNMTEHLLIFLFARWFGKKNQNTYIINVVIYRVKKISSVLIPFDPKKLLQINKSKPLQWPCLQNS